VAVNIYSVAGKRIEVKSSTETTGEIIMQDKAWLEWPYTPTNYFERPFKFKNKNYEIEICDGRVKVMLFAEEYHKLNTIPENLIDDIRSKIDFIFMAVQLETHSPYDISKTYSFHYAQPNGRESVTIRPEAASMKVSVSSVDFKVTDSKGNVIVDTRAERIHCKKEFAKLALKYGPKDKTTQSVLRSFRASINDPGNSLVHLYEILDALKKKFSTREKALTALHISDDTRWDRLHKLANDEPLKEGRHRGSFPGQLRNATQQEVEEATKIAEEMILKYFYYLNEIESKDYC